MRRIALACALGLSALTPSCIILDATDLGYMATHHGRHIDEPVSASGGEMPQGAAFGPSDKNKTAAGGQTAGAAGGFNAGQLTAARDSTARAINAGKPSGAGTNALTTGQFIGDQMTLRPPATRPGGLTEGTVPGYGPDSPASGGQVVSALGLASSITNPASMIAGAASEDNTNRTLLGRQWDSMFGGKPGTPVSTRNPIANNTNARGDVLQQNADGVLADRASGAATAALTGDSPSGAGTDALFSDVTLQDRRKPKSNLAGTQMLMKAA